MEKEQIQRLLSDIRNSEKLFFTTQDEIQPTDIPPKLAVDYCVEFYPFELESDIKSIIRYYMDLKKVRKMKLELRPIYMERVLKELEKFSNGYESLEAKNIKKSGIIVIAGLLDEICEEYLLKDKFLSIKEATITSPWLDSFETHEKDVRAGLVKLIALLTNSEKRGIELGSYDYELEQYVISFYQILIYGLYSLPTSPKMRKALEEVIARHQKVELRGNK